MVGCDVDFYPSGIRFRVHSLRSSIKRTEKTGSRLFGRFYWRERLLFVFLCKQLDWTSFDCWDSAFGIRMYTFRAKTFKTLQTKNVHIFRIHSITQLKCIMKVINVIISLHKIYLEHNKGYFKPLGREMFRRYPKEAITLQPRDASWLVDTLYDGLWLAKG